MHLQRVQVPDFRVLKDVDITFEKDFNPRVFPLGSQNGGGKSTLLQLIFVLLHCSTNPDRLQALKNLLNGFNLLDGQEQRVLSIINIWDGNKSVHLDFFVCGDSYVNSVLESDNLDVPQQGGENNLTFDIFSKRTKIEEQISNLVKSQEELEDLMQRFSDDNIMLSAGGNFSEFSNLLRRTRGSLQKFRIEAPTSIHLERSLVPEIHKNINFKLEKTYEDIKNKISDSTIQLNDLNLQINELIESLESKDIQYITTYRSGENDTDNIALLCHIYNLDASDIDSPRQFLDGLSNKVFLAAPSTQIFLFLPRNIRKSLFGKRDEIYKMNLEEVKSDLTGLFTYDFLAVNYLVDLFQQARDKDFKSAIETGEYGENYKLLLNELNSLMISKRAYLKPDLDSSLHLSGVGFRENKSTDSIELYPEDLSHGELKRLSIYCWLKYKNIEDSIVLMDEIDIALHPDWQYQIVSDLLEWSAKNQYILATHSYELCNALTPSHVKVLEPKLTERRSD